MKKIFLSLLSIFALMFIASCYTPSPLYGTWSDNSGNKITFISDGTFVAKVKDQTDKFVNYEGDFSTIDNVLIFSYQADGVSRSMNTEWDIRGSMLYCTWSFDGNQTVKLTLYHTAR
ncbi:MAG: hypothetical protein ACTTI5_00570 [Treponema sp.]